MGLFGSACAGSVQRWTHWIFSSRQYDTDFGRNSLQVRTMWRLKLYRGKCCAGLIVFVACSILAVPAHAVELVITDDQGRPVKGAAIGLVRNDVSNTETLEPPAKPVEIIQRKLQFHPRMTALRKDATVTFPNFDRTDHHVYSFSEPKRFELPLYRRKRHVVHFEKEGIITLSCNIHDWMRAYIVVFDSQYLGVTDNTGNLEIPDFPPGSYTLRYWHPSLSVAEGIRDKSITFEPEQQNIQITLPKISKFKWPTKPAYLQPDDY